MKVINECSLDEFQAWGGAERTINKLIAEGKCADAEAIIEDLYPDGITETQLNDFLIYDADSLYEGVGIPTYDGLKNELVDLEYDYEVLTEGFKDEFDDALYDHEREQGRELDDSEKEKIKNEIYENSYKDDMEEIKARMQELEEKLKSY